MDILKKTIAFIFIFFIVVSCSNDDEISVPEVSDQNLFVWDAMNYWYFYKDDSPGLADSKTDDMVGFANFLNSFTSPVDLFNDLLPDIDRFSFIVHDFIALEQSFQGTSTNPGFDFTPIAVSSSNNMSGASDEALMIINYVIPNSPAYDAGIERGEIAWGIDGVQFTRSNFFDLIGQSSFTINFANTSLQGNEVFWQPNGRSIQISRVPLTENPVFFEGVIDLNGIRVGYLVYNQFTATFHGELNDAFRRLRSSSIDELVLDLRYNSGGRVDTSVFLTSMINGGTPAGQPLARLLYRSPDRSQEFNSVLRYENELRIYDGNGDDIGGERINRLGNLNRVFILTGSRTASASELVINELSSKMEVVLLGNRTEGKNEASLTLYDNQNINDRYLSRERANPNHRWALQPTIAQVGNSQGFSDYARGFPLNGNVTFIEEEYALGTSGLEPLGDLNEPLLQMALDQIEGSPIRPNRILKSPMLINALKPIRAGEGKMLLDGLVKPK